MEHVGAVSTHASIAERFYGTFKSLLKLTTTSARVAFLRRFYARTVIIAPFVHSNCQSSIRFGKTSRFVKSKRNESIRQRYERGESIHDLGEAYDLVPESIRGILKSAKDGS
ncbi:MAG: hypothetical protein ABGX22_28555 [Pirellulaceae bacterium]